MHQEEHDRDESDTTTVGDDPPPEDNRTLYANGAVIVPPRIGIRYPRAPLGPGNETMAGGASPAPRGLTGGAMGKYVAGLSPSFADAAMGQPAPGGSALYSAAEAVATFGPPRSGAPEPTPQPSLDTPEVHTASLLVLEVQDATPPPTEGATEQPA